MVSTKVLYSVVSSPFCPHPINIPQTSAMLATSISFTNLFAGSKEEPQAKAKEVEVTRIDRTTYDKAMTEINNRVDSVMSGLFQIGIQSVRLKTRELAELYYNFNNPDTAVREPLVDFSKMATLYVKKGEKEDE